MKINLDAPNALDAVGYEAGLIFPEGEPSAQTAGSASQAPVAHQLTPAEAKAIRLELDFPDLDRIARSGGHGADLASALRKLDAICNWPDCLDDDEASFELDRAPRKASGAE